MKVNKIIIRNLKKSLAISLASASIFLISSCANNKNIQEYINDAIAIAYQDNTPYLINAKKDTYSLAAYDEVEDIFDDYISVKQNGKYGFINKRGEEIIKPIYDKVYPMKEEKAVVIKDGISYIIDINNNILYTLENGITSESYFSQNHLVIKKDNLYGYLKYENNEFTIIEPQFNYAATYLNDYAVVGKLETEEIYDEDTGEVTGYTTSESLLYNYLTLDDTILFDEFTFEYADNFYEGYAIVGHTGTYKCYYADATSATQNVQISVDGMLYNYIDANGNYLHYNFSYEHTYVSGSTTKTDQVTVKDIVEVPYAIHFNDGLAVTAIYAYSKTTEKYVKEYQIIDLEGTMPFINAIYYATSYRYGYDSIDDYRTYSPSQFKLEALYAINNTHVFVTGNTLTTSTFTFRYYRYDYERKCNMFETIVWDLDEEIINDDGSTSYVTPDWITEYGKTYFPTATTDILSRNSASLPYEVGNMKIISNYQFPIISLRITRSNKFGLITFTYTEAYDELGNDDYTIVHAKYILDPIYDKIIY